MVKTLTFFEATDLEFTGFAKALCTGWVSHSVLVGYRILLACVLDPTIAESQFIDS